MSDNTLYISVYLLSLTFSPSPPCNNDNNIMLLLITNGLHNYGMINFIAYSWIMKYFTHAK